MWCTSRNPWPLRLMIVMSIMNDPLVHNTHITKPVKLHWLKYIITILKDLIPELYRNCRRLNVIFRNLMSDTKKSWKYLLFTVTYEFTLKKALFNFGTYFFLIFGSWLGWSRTQLYFSRENIWTKKLFDINWLLSIWIKSYCLNVVFKYIRFSICLQEFQQNFYSLTLYYYFIQISDFHFLAFKYILPVFDMLHIFLQSRIVFISNVLFTIRIKMYPIGISLALFEFNT
jgi:hypothetical protein